MDEQTGNQNNGTSSPEVPPREIPEARTSYKPLIALVLGVVASVGGYFAYDHFTVDAVAVVNGEKITRVALDENIAMMTKSAELQGIDVTDPAVAAELQAQALTNLVNNELLLGAARRAGMNTNEAAVQTAYDTLVTEVGGEEELKVRMETVGLSSEKLRGNISDRLMVDAYIEAETDIENITVGDEEIEAYLAAITTDGITLPSLEEIRPQIEATIIAEKQQTIVNELIERLRAEGEITILE